MKQEMLGNKEKGTGNNYCDTISPNGSNNRLLNLPEIYRMRRIYGKSKVLFSCRPVMWLQSQNNTTAR